jgi:hypothetical protein
MRNRRINACRHICRADTGVCFAFSPIRHAEIQAKLARGIIKRQQRDEPRKFQDSSLDLVLSTSGGFLRGFGARRDRGRNWRGGRALPSRTPNDVRRAGDPALKDWLAWMRKYQPNASTGDLYNVQGYTAAQLMALVLKNCGDDLSRDNIIRQIKSLNGVALPMMLPGITVHTDPRNVTPIRQSADGALRRQILGSVREVLDEK